MTAARFALAALFLAGALQAAEAPVTLLVPAPGTALFDRVEVRAHTAEELVVERLVVLLDGEPVGAVESPPWRLEIDTGPENRNKLVEVIAYGGGRELGRARLLAPAIPVDDRVDLPLQQLYVTVTDRRGSRVPDLERDEFTLRDDGRRREIVTFAGGEIPFTATLLVDGSGSMAGDELAIVLRGAESFVAGMRPLDQARLVVFSDRLLQVTPFLAAERRLTPPMRASAALGGTAILDHLYMALAELETRLGRRVVVLLSDGLDLHSAIDPDGLLEVARRSQAIVYWVRPGVVVSPDLLRPVPLSSLTSAEDLQETLDTLQEIVEGSGGRTVPVPSLADAGAALANVLAELREQYALGYYPDRLRGDGSWRRVRVEVSGRRRVRTQSGYYDRPRKP